MACLTGTSRNCWPSAASPWTTSPSIGRSSGSRPEFIEAARPCRHVPGDRWFADETYVKVAGRWTYLYRAIDQHGQVIDVLLSQRRDLAAARRFFARALHAGTIPAEVTTDRAPAYPRGRCCVDDPGWRETGPVTAHHATSAFAGFRFPREVI